VFKFGGYERRTSALGKVVSESLDEKICTEITTDNYQYWLNKYFDFVGSRNQKHKSFGFDDKPGNENTEQTPNMGSKFFRKRFGRKGEDLPDDRMVSFIPVSWGGIKNWLIERELVLDASGNKALVERTMSMSGQLTKLTVIHDSGVYRKFTYRSEERIDRGEFGNDLTLTIDQSI